MLFTYSTLTLLTLLLTLPCTFALYCNNDKCYCGDGTIMQYTPPKANGCGAYINNWYVSTFVPICNTHDLCYSTCGVSRSSCDNIFCSELTSTCTSEFTGELYEICLERANLYCSAVQCLGFNAFSNAQNNHCQCSSKRQLTNNTICSVNCGSGLECAITCPGYNEAPFSCARCKCEQETGAYGVVWWVPKCACNSSNTRC